MDILNAAEAREQALSVNTERNSELLRCIGNKIDEAITKGATSIYWHSKVYAPVKMHLESLGYLVTEFSDYREITTTISW